MFVVRLYPNCSIQVILTSSSCSD
uniref:Uncharacterized protein n=1 Tax=Arundo donax TaxID=35708 RepID=A0A0A8ZFN8_ARUDO